MTLIKNENVLSLDIEILQNIANCISDKMSILNIKMPELAKNANVDYYSVRKILNLEPNYMPNLRILVRLADYLNIKVGDLLIYNDLPQYIPLMEKDNVLEFLNSPLSFSGFNNKIFNEKYIHEYAFAVKELNEEMIIPAMIIYVCYPIVNPVITKEKIYLFKIEENNQVIILFGRVLKVSNKKITVFRNSKTQIFENYSVIGIVVSMQMNEQFI